MIFKNFTWSLLTALILISFIPKNVQAQTANNPKQLKIGFDGGTTITWDGTKEVIRKMWLDNPTFANIDIYGCVEGWNDCEQSDAQIIHLKRNNDLKLKHVPQVNTTLLTIITEDIETKAKKLYFYQINKAKYTAQRLEIAASAPKTQEIVRRQAPAEKQQFGLPPEILAQKIEAAVKKAKQNPNLDSKTTSNLTVFANLLKLGTAEKNALALSGVSEGLVKQILINQ